MSLSEFSVRRPVFMTMVYMLMSIISFVFIRKIDQSTTPNINLPYISVFANCGDSDADSVELQVTRTIEDAVSGIKKLKKITSQSFSGRAFVMLEFDYGTDLDKAERDVSSNISMLSRFLPSWVTSVNTFKMNTLFSSESFMDLTVDGPYAIEELKEISSNTVLPLLNRIKGMGEVDISGGGDMEFRVEIDPNRLSAYNLTIDHVKDALKSQNAIGTGGEVTLQFINFSVLTDSRYRKIEDILNTKINDTEGSIIYIKDVANVIRAAERGVSYSYLNGHPTVSISLYQASDASVSKVAKLTKEAIPEINSRLPKGVRLNIIRDNSKNITATINETYSSLVLGVVFAALIIFLFLRNIKSTIIISLSMPISVLFTLAFMGIFKISMNVVSMSGLILGIGMIVDASIVILENITRFRSEGRGAAASAILGSRNMTNAIVASTLTTICVFLPLIIYMNDLEMIGQMLKDLVFTVCISLMCSLFVSITLVPSLAGSVLAISTTTQKPKKGLFAKADSFLTNCQSRLEEAYGILLEFFIKHKIFLILPLVVMLMYSITLVPGLGVSLFSSSDSANSIILDLKLAEGTDSSITEKYVFAMQEKIKDTLPEGSYNSIMCQIITNSNKNRGSVSINLPDIQKQKYKAKVLKDMLIPHLSSDPSANWSLRTSREMGSSKPVDVQISSDDNTLMASTITDILNAMEKNQNMLVNIQSDFTGGAPRINVVVDKDRADSLGVTPEGLASFLLSAISGTKATQISTMSNIETYDVKVMLDKKYLADTNALNSLLIPTNRGEIRLDSIAKLEISQSPTVILRENKRRISHITADIRAGFTSSDAAKYVEHLIDENISIPEGVDVEIAGDMKEFAKHLPTFIIIALLALVLVFAVMAAQFESLKNPFIIFMTVPLLLIGVFVIQRITRQPVSMMSILGIIALIGTVVNNGIVLVDSISQEIRKNRTKVVEACITCSKNRLRPILMTTLTTILGMVPMAFFPGDGAKMMQPIAFTFIGGIITGAFLTLLLSPVLFALINRKLDKKLDDANSLENQLRIFDEIG